MSTVLFVHGTGVREPAFGAPLFPGRVEDVEVDNGQPFPQSHSAYRANPKVWDAIVSRLP